MQMQKLTPQDLILGKWASGKANSIWCQSFLSTALNVILVVKLSYVHFLNYRNLIGIQSLKHLPATETTFR